MAHVIAQPCVGLKDGACIAVCPVDCIHPAAEERAFKEEDMLYIDARSCIDCGLCIDECPSGAIFHEDSLPSQWRSFIFRNAEYYARRRLPPRFPPNRPFATT